HCEGDAAPAVLPVPAAAPVRRPVAVDTVEGEFARPADPPPASEVVDVVEPAVEPDAGALHREAQAAVEPVDPMLPPQTGRGHGDADRPCLGGGVVLRDPEAGQPGRAADRR